MRAGAEQLIFQTLAGALARHLDQPELGDFENVGARFVFFQRFPQSFVDLLAIGLFFHVDEVDDDEAADVSQPELAHDLLHRLDIGLEDRFFLIAFADEAAGVDVHSRQRFGPFDDDVAARAQPDARGPAPW